MKSQAHPQNQRYRIGMRVATRMGIQVIGNGIYKNNEAAMEIELKEIDNRPKLIIQLFDEKANDGCFPEVVEVFRNGKSMGEISMNQSEPEFIKEKTSMKFELEEIYRAKKEDLRFSLKDNGDDDNAIVDIELLANAADPAANDCPRDMIEVHRNGILVAAILLYRKDLIPPHGSNPKTEGE